jgi:hypothetical protein
VVVGFVAPQVASKQPGLSIAALAAFVVSAVAGVFVLSPRRGFDFAENLRGYVAWIEDYGADPGADDSFTKGLVVNLEASRKRNKPKITNRAIALALQCLLFGVEVALWAIAAVVR